MQNDCNSQISLMEKQNGATPTQKPFEGFYGFFFKGVLNNPTSQYLGEMKTTYDRN